MAKQIWRLVYNCLLLPLIWLGAKVAALKNEKVMLGFRRRTRLWARMDKYLKNRDFSRPLIWFHAASAGEFLQAQPLLELFLENDYECALTFSSVSAEKWIKKNKFSASRQPLFMDYLPYDFAFLARRWINTVKPSALILVRSELWPNTIWQAEKSGVPQYLISAALPSESARYSSKVARSLYSNLYSCFKGICAVSEEDKKRFLEHGLDSSQIEVVGDTRFDSVINRRDRLPAPSLPEYIKEKIVFVAGSSWPPDEQCILPVLKKALRNYKNLVLIIAPHEPFPEHLESIAEYFRDFKTIFLSQITSDSKQAEVILVDSVGVLALLYRSANLAYVGGGFTTGVHNVMEPAAMGLPIICGPLHNNSGEALHLIQEGSGFSVNESKKFEKLLSRLLDNPQETKKLGIKAQKYVESQSGAARRCFELISGELK